MTMQSRVGQASEELRAAKCITKKPLLQVKGFESFPRVARINQAAAMSAPREQRKPDRKAQPSGTPAPAHSMGQAGCISAGSNRDDTSRSRPSRSINPGQENL